jgi:hypothetical protein
MQDSGYKVTDSVFSRRHIRIRNQCSAIYSCKCTRYYTPEVDVLWRFIKMMNSLYWNSDEHCPLYQAYFFNVLGVGLSPLGTAATTGLLYQPQMIDDGDCGALGGIGRENRRTQRKPVPVPLCPLQIPHDLIKARTRAAAVGNQRLTAWAMARPVSSVASYAFFASTNAHATIITEPSKFYKRIER